MRLPGRQFLYVVSAGLLGLAIYTLYQSVQHGHRDVRKRASDLGVADGDGLLAKGKGLGRTTSNWNYDVDSWRQRFVGPNLTGEQEPICPPPPPPPGPDRQRPLDDIVELVSLVHDGSRKGEGGKSHVIVRYRENTDVKPPLWYLAENQALAGAPAGGRIAANRQPSNQPRPGPRPTSSAGMEIVQRVWVESDGSLRSETTLWPPYDDIKLVRVAADARSAWFVRTPPPPEEGKKAAEPVEERLLKSTMPLSPDVIAAVYELLRRDESRLAAGAPTPAPVAASSWQDLAETRRIGDVVHVSRKDQRTLQQKPEDLLDGINVDTYVSRQGTKVRGLRVLNISSELSARFDVHPNDLILSINDTPVSTKADAIAVIKRLYNRGVRTFVIRFLSDGRELERNYRVPDR